MKRSLSILTLVSLSILIAMTALAGHDKKCDEPTEACLKAMTAKYQSKGWLGVELDKNDHGRYKITKVVHGSPAEAAGFKTGDILLALNGIELSEANRESLHKTKKGLKPGAAATYTVKRAGGKEKLAVTFGSVPFEVMASWIGEHMLSHHAGAVLAQN